MKKFILFVLLFSTFCLSQTWKKAVTQTFPPLGDIVFVNENQGWCVGTDGAILITSNGGQNWIRSDISTLEDMNTAYFIDANVGYTGGTNGSLYKTTNGGQSWTPITVTGYLGTVYGIYFSDQQHGWVMTSVADSARILRTTDGGANWVISYTNSPGDLEAMTFYSPTKGIAVGGGVGKVDLVYTTDGINWTKSPTPTNFPSGIYTRSDVRAVCFLDASNVVAVGWGSRAAGLQPSICLKSTNSGATWTYMTQTDENKVYVNLNGVKFKDVNNGIAVGGGAYEGSVVYKTTDGGVTWFRIPAPFGVTLKAVSIVNNKIWAIAGDGTIIYSPDFGNSGDLQTKIPSSTLYAAQFVNDSTGFFAGFNGLVLKTTDRGKNWKASFSFVNFACPTIKDMHFLNSNVGYLAKSYRSVVKTTNGGLEWFSILSDTFVTGVNIEGVHFVNENLGFVVGRLANNVDAVYKTTNGGQTWSLKSNAYAKNLNDVSFFDANKGILVGNSGTIAYTTDGGEIWTKSTNITFPPGTTNPNLLKVVFLTSTNAVVTGDNTILYTTNGGVNWTYPSPSTIVESLPGLFFFNATTGYAIGSKTSGSPKSIAVYKTTDGGLNWTNISDLSVFDTTRTINGGAVEFNGNVWVGGSSSYIYTNSPLVDAFEYGYEAPSSFILYQNYPNPFNPSTTIKYEVESPKFVSIKIYDVLGNEVSTLVNENKTAGKYEVNFSVGSKNLSSGIYFYKLQCGSKVQTKKMMLLK